MNKTFSGMVCLVGSLALGILAFSCPVFFLFSVARKWRGHNDLVGNHKGSFMCLKSWFPFFFFSCLWQFCTLFRHCLVQQPFCIFCFFFLPIFDREIFFFFRFPPIFDRGFSLFLCFPPIFDGEFSLFFCFLKHIHNLTVNETPFFGRSFCSFFLGQG